MNDSADEGMKVIEKFTLLPGESREVISFIPEIQDSDFLKVYPVFGQKVLEDDLKGAVQVFLCFFNRLMKRKAYDDNPEITLPWKQISEETRLKRTQIISHLKTLVEKRYLVRLDVFTYRINPSFVFRGKVGPLQFAQKQFEASWRESQGLNPAIPLDTWAAAAAAAAKDQRDQERALLMRQIEQQKVFPGDTDQERGRKEAELELLQKTLELTPALPEAQLPTMDGRP